MASFPLANSSIKRKYKKQICYRAQQAEGYQGHTLLLLSAAAAAAAAAHKALQGRLARALCLLGLERAMIQWVQMMTSMHACRLEC
jgi:hypothetical protein